MPRSRGRSGRPWQRATRAQRTLGLPCWLCHQPIDYTLPDNHDDAFSADHEIPVSHLPAGHPLLTDPGNLRSAHRRCNSERGASGQPTRLRSRAW